MAFQEFPDGVAAVIEYGGVTVTWSNTLWFKLLALQNHDLQELADYLFDWAEAEICPMMYSGWNLEKVTCYDMSSEGGTVRTSSQVAVPGEVEGDPASIASSLVVTLYSDRRGRSGRGRNYLAGFVEADVGASVISNGARLIEADAAYTTLIDDIQLNTSYYWVIASRQHLGAPRAEIVGYDVQNIDVRNATLGTQRRRIGKD
jgi:hypothetical protein